jgi:hypothetical protein
MIHNQGQDIPKKPKPKECGHSLFSMIKAIIYLPTGNLDFDETNRNCHTGMIRQRTKKEDPPRGGSLLLERNGVGQKSSDSLANR